MILYWIILMLLIIVIVLAIVRINVSSKETVEKTMSISNLGTGDLLFVSYKNSLGAFMKAWSMSKWTHIAMVYKAPDNELYVMETANYPDIKGVLFLPIAEWYRYNKNCEIAVKKLHKPKHFDDTKVINSFEKLVDKKLDTFGTSWLRLLTKKKYATLEDKQNITCYELVIHILQEIDVVKKEQSPSSYFPKNIVDNSLPLHKHFSFSEMFKLKM